MKLRLLHWSLGLAACMLLALPVSAQNSTVVNADGSSYQVDFLGTTNGGLTWNYRVTELTGRSLSHFVIELCTPDFVSASPDGTDPGIQQVSYSDPDASTGITGIKWDLEDNYDNAGGDNDDSRVFSFTLAEVYTAVPVAVGVKTGGDDKTGTSTINGPSCEPCVGDPPSWDGSVDKVNDMHFLPLNAPAGFGMIRFYAGVNLTVVGLFDSAGGADITADFDVSTDAGTHCPSFPALTCWKATYTGAGPNPTTVYAKIAPTNAASPKVSFFLELTDICGQTVDVDPVLDLARVSNEVPEVHRLRQNYPNPFNPTTTIAFEVAESAQVDLVIYDVLGQEVVRLVSGVVEPGQYEVNWDGRDAAGIRVASGMYLYRLSAGTTTKTMTMTMLK